MAEVADYETPVPPPPGSPDDPAVRAAARTSGRAPRTSDPGLPDVGFADPGARAVTVPLRHPMLIGGERIEAITVRRLTGRELYEIALGDADEAAIIRRVRALMTGLPEGALEECDADDATEVAAVIRPFWPRAILSLVPPALGGDDEG